MNFTIIKKIPTAEEIIQAFPLSEEAHQNIARDRQEVKDILAGRDERTLVIVGPCSAWPFNAVLEYTERVKKLSDQVKDKLKLVMRVYIQKPRTTRGWTGPVNQPDPFAPPDVAEGIKYCRGLMVKILDMGMPIADEALFTHNAKGFLELLSWVAIGARSSEDQEHRIFASAINCAVGMKNPTSGDVEIGVNSVVAAQHPHIAVFDGHQVETSGNEFAHLVLRGGSSRPNYHIEDIMKAKKAMAENEVKNPAIVIDASHDNCKINGVNSVERQIQVVREVMSNLREFPELRKIVRGFMIESFLKPGNQKLNPDSPDSVDMGGLSITDPCLGWKETERLIGDLV